MIKKLIFLNFALLALVAFLAYRLNADLNKFRAGHNINKIKAEAAANAKKANGKKAAPPNTVAATTTQPTPPPGEYNIIVDKNLFSEDRTVAKEPVVVNKPQPPELNPKPNLYGIIEDMSGRWALIEDTVLPVGPPVGPQPPRQLVASPRKSIIKLKQGDSYHSYKVTEIAYDRITLTYGDNEKIEYIPLFDKNKPKPVAGVFGAQPLPHPMPVTPPSGQVVSIGVGGQKPGMPGQPGQAGVGYQPPQPLPSPGMPPGTGSSVTSIPSTSTGSTPGAAGTIAQPGSTTTRPSTGATSPRKGAGSGREFMKGGKKYIRTPFGDVPKEN